MDLVHGVLEAVKLSGGFSALLELELERKEKGRGQSGERMKERRARD